MPDLRIVSLIASATEIACALGFQDSLVGRSHECDYPTPVKGLPQVTSPKFPCDGTSYEIDQKVKAIVAESLSVYRVDARKLEQLKPSHILTQDHCEVCAVSLSDVEEAVCQILNFRADVVSLSPDCLADIFADVMRVAGALGSPEKGEELNAKLKKRMDDIAYASGRATARPRVAFIEWISPAMVGGNWMPELIDMAGGENLIGRAGAHSPQIEMAELQNLDPEIVIIAPCGFDIARTGREAHLVAGALAGTSALKTGKVYLADGNQYFNRPGPRIVDSLEILAELIHPETFSFGHEGRGWQKYSG